MTEAFIPMGHWTPAKRTRRSRRMATRPINDGPLRRDMTLVFDVGDELAQAASHEIDAPRIHDGRPAVKPARCPLAEIIPRIAAGDTSAPRES